MNIHAAWTARLRRFGLGVAFVLLALSFLAAPFGAARAGSRGVGIGVGTGLQLLNDLAKSGSKKGGVSKKKRYDADKRSGSKAKKKPRNDEREPETVSKSGEELEASKAQDDDAPKGPGSEAAPAAVPAAAATAPAATAALPSATGASSNLISTPEEMASAQQHLRYLGYELSAEGGKLDLSTRIAIMKFQDSIGAQTTGSLTVEQLQRLYVLADERQKQGK